MVPANNKRKLTANNQGLERNPLMKQNPAQNFCVSLLRWTRNYVQNRQQVTFSVMTSLMSIELQEGLSQHNIS